MTDSNDLTPQERFQVEQMRKHLANPSVRRSLDDAMNAAADTQRWYELALATLRDAWQAATQALASVDWVRVAEQLRDYQDLMPSNMSARASALFLGIDVSAVTVPIAWVVPADLVEPLLLANSSADRLDLALEHQDAILDQCEAILAGESTHAAAEMLEAVEVLRLGRDGPAQSHAANVIDSVLLAAFATPGGRDARRAALSLASKDFPTSDEVSVRLFVSRLVMGPLVTAYVRWHPADGGPPPPDFSRHATSHAAHTGEVFSPANALVAVMLGTSLVRHCRSQLAALDGPDLAIATTGQ